tara:strand:- start:193 stop:534 length:342 start_codon:yes stop_codon:yes gene_type:complete
MVFKNKEDVWSIIDKLLEEVRNHNLNGHNFDEASSIVSQLNFFCCPNCIIRKQDKRDIQRFIYCQEANIPAYPGDYTQHPARWVDRFFIINHAMKKKIQIKVDKEKKVISNGK